jgi:hypothetical protein
MYADGLEHVNFPKEYASGKKGFRNGKSLQENPFDWGSDKYQAWEQGWNDAFGKEYDEGQA